MYNINSLLKRPAHAAASIKGSIEYPNIKGKMLLYQTRSCVIVITEISGLPRSTDVCNNPIFAYHIHSGNSCTGNKDDYFADALTHYNPDNCPHPYHRGDLPPLFSANGIALSAFLTNRFTVKEVIGKTVVIHSAPDDFTTQPAGNSGRKIACGVIKKL